MDILQAIRQRITAKSFNGKQIEPEILERILEVGRLAPSAKNRQPWRFIAIQKPEAKEILSNACFGDRRIIDSGCIIAACTTNIQYRMSNGQPSHPLDIAFAVSHMALQATHEGLASAVFGTYDERILKDLLSIPYSMQVVLLLVLGYSDDAPPSLTKRFPKDRIINYEHW